MTVVNNQDAKPSHVDVLIIGAGPSGLMLSLWLATLGVKTRIVDKRADKINVGHADGLQSRTLEILDSFGIGKRVWDESNHLIEVCFWTPDKKTGTIHRNARAPDSKPGISRFTEVVLHQGFIETYFLDAINSRSCPPVRPLVRVERSVSPSGLELDEDVAGGEGYPIRVTLRHTGSDEGEGEEEEMVMAKYVVGCDGAHSWVRKALGEGFEMVGESTDFIWGVLDIIPITDFPDIRNRCVIHSANSGTLMVIPRENRLVRLYIQLKQVSVESGRVNRSKITPEVILENARRIIAPYSLEYTHLDWWTAYQIGQRCGNRFDKQNRVFLAGDAVHTHSPKAGQGMNVSIQDTFNLGWKLGLVCQKILRPEVLSTYELERKEIARQLIEYDEKLAKMFSGKPSSEEEEEDADDTETISMKKFQDGFELSHMFTSGIGVHYQPSIITHHHPLSSSSTASATATNCTPGKSLLSYKLLSQSDSRPHHLQSLLPSDGRFRIIVFGGSIITHPSLLTLVNQLGAFIRRDLLPRYPTIKTTSASRLVLPAGGGKTTVIDSESDPSVVDVLLVHAAKREDVELSFLDEAYRPFDKRFGWDYTKVFVDGESYHEGHGRVYENYGIDVEKGAVVVVRPDGYIGLVTDLDGAVHHLKGYFDGVLVISSTDS